LGLIIGAIFYTLEIYCELGALAADAASGLSLGERSSLIRQKVTFGEAKLLTSATRQPGTAPTWRLARAPRAALAPEFEKPIGFLKANTQINFIYELKIFSGKFFE